MKDKIPENSSLECAQNEAHSSELALLKEVSEALSILFADDPQLSEASHRLQLAIKTASER